MATVSQRTLKAKVVNTFHPGHRKVVALDGAFTLGRKLHFSVSGRTCECLVNHHGLAVSYMGHCGNAHQGSVVFQCVAAFMAWRSVQPKHEEGFPAERPPTTDCWPWIGALWGFV